MQIQATMIYHLTEWLLSKRQKITSVDKDVEKREPLCTIGGIINSRSHCENSREVSQKIKSRTAIYSSNSSSEYLSQGDEKTDSKRYLYFHVHCSITHNTQDMKTT